MNALRVTELYVSACRALLLCDVRDPDTCESALHLLPFLRHALTCLTCGNLVQEPMSLSASTSSCQHAVCSACRLGAAMLKPACRCCQKLQHFEENKQLRLLVACYGGVCRYVATLAASEPLVCRTRGYAEVLRMLEEVLGASNVAELPEPEPQWRDASGAQNLQGDAAVDSAGQQVGSSTCEDVNTEFNMVTLVTEAAGDAQSNKKVDVDAQQPGSAIVQHGSAVSVLANASKVKNSFMSDCTKPPEVLDTKTQSVNDSGQQLPQNANRGTLVPAHSQQPQTGSSATQKRARLSRKRSCSESDSVLLQPPNVQKSSSSSVVPHMFSPALANIGALNASRALLDSAQNIQNKTKMASRKCPPKSKAVFPKTKVKVRGNPTVPAKAGKLGYKKFQEKKEGCKCGRATANPSVLTCRGQRCPCYSQRKACLGCICRGCQNSYMANGEKKLEAFAKPEMVLEQSHLALGINLAAVSVLCSGRGGGGSAGAGVL